MESELSNPIDAAKAPGVFSLDKFLADVAYPEEEVTLFTDAYSVNELMKLRAKRDELQHQLENSVVERGPRTIAGNEDTPAAKLKKELAETLEALQTQIDEYDDRVASSAITFHLRGMPQRIVEEITKKHFVEPNKDYSNTPEEDARDLELIAHSIVRVTDAQGNVDTSPMTVERVLAVRGAVLPNEYVRLVQHVAHVNLNGALFEAATDASFLSRRTDVAWEQGLHNNDQGGAELFTAADSADS